MQTDQPQPISIFNIPEKATYGKALFPLSVMAGAEWNVLDARGIRVACCKFGEGKEAENTGIYAAQRIVAMANDTDSRVRDESLPPIQFESLLIHSLFFGDMKPSYLDKWANETWESDGATHGEMLIAAVAGVLEHVKREEGNPLCVIKPEDSVDEESAL